MKMRESWDNFIFKIFSGIDPWSYLEITLRNLWDLPPALDYYFGFPMVYYSCIYHDYTAGLAEQYECVQYVHVLWYSALISCNRPFCKACFLTKISVVVGSKRMSWLPFILKLHISFHAIYSTVTSIKVLNNNFQSAEKINYYFIYSLPRKMFNWIQINNTFWVK